MPVSAERLFQWHASPGAIDRLIPPWVDAKVITYPSSLQDGVHALFETRVYGKKIRWEAIHRECIPNRQFVDTQISGPFSYWEHRHLFEPRSENESLLSDHIRYRLPLFSRLFAKQYVASEIERLFRYRHQVTLQDLRLHQTYNQVKPMKILVTGATGLIGSALIPFLQGGGHQVTRVIRQSKDQREGDLVWNGLQPFPKPSSLEGYDAVIHLAGENISSGRWTEERKKKIIDSRVESTRYLVEALKTLQKPPKVLINASAIGYYGDRGQEQLTEESSLGSLFLSDGCQKWEAAAKEAEKQNIRTVFARFGVVLSPKGGALKTMLTPFKLGLGGPIGSGDQFMSWIAMDDVLGAILHLLAHAELSGPVNLTAPKPVTNREFTKTLGHVLNRPTFFKVPAGLIRLLVGQMADELLLSSTYVLPKRLEESGYKFLYPDLEGALTHLLGKSR